MPSEGEDIFDRGGADAGRRRRAAAAAASRRGPAPGRPWISVYFECCNVYARIYRKAGASAYRGWCPRCARQATVWIGPGGTSSRFFRAR